MSENENNQKDWWRGPLGWKTLLSVILIAIVTIIVFAFFDLGLTDEERNLILTIGGVIGGPVGLFLATWRSDTAARQADAAMRQADVAMRQVGTGEQRLITERYSEAVKLLSSKDTLSRLVGITTLSRITEDDPKEYTELVATVFMQFIRTPPYKDEQERRYHERQERIREGGEEEENIDIGEQIGKGILCPDIHTAISMIGVLRTYGLREVYVYMANLLELNLEAAELQGFNLLKARFEGANLQGAHLENASLRAAYFEGADLRMARLEGADFWNAHLKGAMHLTQSQINTASATHPPIDLPEDIEWPFEPWERSVDGNFEKYVTRKADPKFWEGLSSERGKKDREDIEKMEKIAKEDSGWKLKNWY